MAIASNKIMIISVIVCRFIFSLSFILIMLDPKNKGGAVIMGRCFI